MTAGELSLRVLYLFVYRCGRGGSVMDDSRPTVIVYIIYMFTQSWVGWVSDG